MATDDEGKVKKERDPIMTVCFIVFILIVCAISGASIYNNYIAADNTKAVVGSTVSVNYVGSYHDYFNEDNAVVFDTNKWSVANDSSIIKSNGFVKYSESSYTPLSFTVGGTTVLTGFGNSVIGYKVGDVVRVMIPPGEGYNAASSYTTVSASTINEMPLTETLTASQFNNLYGYDLKGFKEMDKTVYGWPATASYNSASNTIKMTYLPQSGVKYTAVDGGFGKVELNVTSVTGGKIYFKYEVSGYTVVDGTNIQMIMVDFGTEKFYITSVSGSTGGIANSFTYRTVEERYNQALFFEVEIVTIS
jgi:hypothetical protein